MSIAIQADPGSGKTSLAKSLANAFNFMLIRFDVTQMTRRDDLLDLFDAIVTAQSEGSNKVMVFIDEINAILEGWNVYSTFLAPLEEGTYVRRGRTFSLNPCVWVFAGTKLVQDEGDQERRESRRRSGDKLSDFNSRMTLIEKIDINSLLAKKSGEDEIRLINEAKLEQVYLGALMIRNYFPDVNEVSYSILKYLYELDPKRQSARKVRRLIQTLRNVQYGRIMLNNCTQEWVGLKNNRKDETMVKLIY